MQTIISFFKGKKTYIVGLLTIVLGALQGNEQMILGGTAMITLRAGMTNSTIPPAQNQI